MDDRWNSRSERNDRENDDYRRNYNREDSQYGSPGNRRDSERDERSHRSSRDEQLERDRRNETGPYSDSWSNAYTPTNEYQ
jgi:hypothetical protein